MVYPIVCDRICSSAPGVVGSVAEGGGGGGESSFGKSLLVVVEEGG